MDLSGLVNALNSPVMEQFLVWAVAVVTGAVGLTTLASALDLFLDAETN